MRQELSILIPVYRYDCRQLVASLVGQASQLDISYEILLGDDCSGGEWYSFFDRSVAQYPSVRVLHAEENIGAGKMRNLLSQEARYSLLLQLDSDVLPRDESFLYDYLEAAAKHPECVIVGGFVYPDQPPAADYMLRYLYGRQIEMRPAIIRVQAPYRGFIAMSALFPRRVALAVPYPAIGMGYEDAYYGYLLEQAEVPILHIDCPVVHQLKESSEAFLSTTRRYVDNLATHASLLGQAPIRLLHVYERLRRLGLAPFAASLWPVLQERIARRLSGAHPDLRLFSLYKLLYLSHRMREQKQLYKNKNG